MVRVKIIKLPNGMKEDEWIKIGKVYEAFELRDEKCKDDYYKHFFALNLGICIFHIAPENVEVIEDYVNKKVGDNNVIIKSSQQKILLVEDGSVDIDDLEDWCGRQDIKLIVYRNGANKPEWLN